MYKCNALLLLYVIINVQIVYVFTFQCSMHMTSTCPNGVVSRWNKRNIGIHLKEWIKSVARVKQSAQKLSKNQTVSDRKKYCNTIAVRRSEYFYTNAPDLIETYSPNITVIGKVIQDQNDSHENKKKFVGPVWADITDQHEWFFDKSGTYRTSGIYSGIDGPTAQAQQAVFHNGLYYGILDNYELKIGKY